MLIIEYGIEKHGRWLEHQDIIFGRRRLASRDPNLAYAEEIAQAMLDSLARSCCRMKDAGSQ